jgi:hypothetical protein
VFGEESRRTAYSWRPHQDSLNKSAHQREAIPGQILRVAEQGRSFAEEIKRTLREVTRTLAREDHEDWLLILEETLGVDQQTGQFRAG